MAANTAIAGQRITAAWLNTNIPGPWTALTLSSGFTAVSGSPACSVRQVNSVTCEIIGAVQFAANALSNGLQFATTPSGWTALPLSFQTIGPAGVTAPNSAANSASYGFVTVGTTGVIRIYGINNSAATNFTFHGFYSLDI